MGYYTIYVYACESRFSITLCENILQVTWEVPLFGIHVFEIRESNLILTLNRDFMCVCIHVYANVYISKTRPSSDSD
jgi:hypothetical protein